MIKEACYQDYSEGRQRSFQHRSILDTQILPEGRARRENATFLNFASNDYLGLSQHPQLKSQASECVNAFGVGATASRLITGNHPLYHAIEEKVAAGKGTETALILCSGYQANLTVLAALADPEVVQKDVVVIADRLCHHSLLQGVALSKASLIRYRHNDYNHLEDTLRRYENQDVRVFLVTESVFGMDGDCADLSIIARLAARYRAMLYVDEAHATGLWGPDGYGLCADHKGAIDVVMGTFGKALGGFGAYIGCSSILREYLTQRCGGLIYSTALPPAVLGAMNAAWELLPKLESERIHVKTEAEKLKKALRAQGWNCGSSTTHIIPIILGDEAQAAHLADTLFEQGVLVPVIRPPTVPKGTSRLRFSISAAHRSDDIDYLIELMQKMVPNLGRSSL